MPPSFTIGQAHLARSRSMAPRMRTDSSTSTCACSSSTLCGARCRSASTWPSIPDRPGYSGVRSGSGLTSSPRSISHKLSSGSGCSPSFLLRKAASNLLMFTISGRSTAAHPCFRNLRWDMEETQAMRGGSGWLISESQIGTPGNPLPQPSVAAWGGCARMGG